MPYLIPYLVHLACTDIHNFHLKLAPVDDVFQKKTDELFSGMPNIFGIADNTLIAGFDEPGTDHNATLDKVLRICRQGNMKLNNDKCLFRCISILFFGEVISQQSVSLHHRIVQALTDMPPPKYKKELLSFLCILIYLSKISPVTAEVCKPLGKLTSVKSDWSWN